MGNQFGCCTIRDRAFYCPFDANLYEFKSELEGFVFRTLREDHVKLLREDPDYEYVDIGNGDLSPQSLRRRGYLFPDSASSSGFSVPSSVSMSNRLANFYHLPIAPYNPQDQKLFVSGRVEVTFPFISESLLTPLPIFGVCLRGKPIVRSMFHGHQKDETENTGSDSRRTTTRESKTSPVSIPGIAKPKTAGRKQLGNTGVYFTVRLAHPHHFKAKRFTAPDGRQIDVPLDDHVDFRKVGFGMDDVESWRNHEAIHYSDLGLNNLQFKASLSIVAEDPNPNDDYHQGVPPVVDIPLSCLPCSGTKHKRHAKCILGGSKKISESDKFYIDFCIVDDHGTDVQADIIVREVENSNSELIKPVESHIGESHIVGNQVSRKRKPVWIENIEEIQYNRRVDINNVRPTLTTGQDLATMKGTIFSCTSHNNDNLESTISIGYSNLSAFSDVGNKQVFGGERSGLTKLNEKSLHQKPNNGGVEVKLLNFCVGHDNEDLEDGNTVSDKNKSGTGESNHANRSLTPTSTRQVMETASSGLKPQSTPADTSLIRKMKSSILATNPSFSTADLTKLYRGSTGSIEDSIQAGIDLHVVPQHGGNYVGMRSGLVRGSHPSQNSMSDCYFSHLLYPESNRYDLFQEQVEYLRKKPTALAISPMYWKTWEFFVRGLSDLAFFRRVGTFSDMVMVGDQHDQRNALDLGDPVDLLDLLQSHKQQLTERQKALQDIHSTRPYGNLWVSKQDFLGMKSSPLVIQMNSIPGEHVLGTKICFRLAISSGHAPLIHSGVTELLQNGMIHAQGYYVGFRYCSPEQTKWTRLWASDPSLDPPFDGHVWDGSRDVLQLFLRHNLAVRPSCGYMERDWSANLGFIPENDLQNYRVSLEIEDSADAIKVKCRLKRKVKSNMMQKSGVLTAEIIGKPMKSSERGGADEYQVHRSEIWEGVPVFCGLGKKPSIGNRIAFYTEGKLDLSKHSSMSNKLNSNSGTIGERATISDSDALSESRDSTSETPVLNNSIGNEINHESPDSGITTDFENDHTDQNPQGGVTPRRASEKDSKHSNAKNIDIHDLHSREQDGVSDVSNIGSGFNTPGLIHSGMLSPGVLTSGMMTPTAGVGGQMLTPNDVFITPHALERALDSTGKTLACDSTGKEVALDSKGKAFQTVNKDKGFKPVGNSFDSDKKKIDPSKFDLKQTDSETQDSVSGAENSAENAGNKNSSRDHSLDSKTTNSKDSKTSTLCEQQKDSSKEDSKTDRLYVDRLRIEELLRRCEKIHDCIRDGISTGGLTQNELWRSSSILGFEQFTDNCQADQNMGGNVVCNRKEIHRLQTRKPTTWITPPLNKVFIGRRKMDQV